MPLDHSVSFFPNENRSSKRKLGLKVKEVGRAPERGDPSKGGVGNAPNHPSSTGWGLGDRGF